YVTGCQCVRQAGFALGNESLGPPALCNIDVDAVQPMRAAIAVIEDENTRFDPANLAIATHDAIVYFVLPSPLAESLTPEQLQSLNVFWMYMGQPFAASDLGRSV